MSEQAYLDLLRDVMENGVDRPDRTGTGTRGVFGRQIRFDLAKGFPLLTTKKMEIKSVLSELIWFIEGSTDERRLAEIRYGKPRIELTDKRTIWTDNARAPYWTPKAQYDGDLGPIYGHNWRNWTTADGGKVDQIADLVHALRSDPNSRRHILLSWNPGVLDRVALPACHTLAQFYVSQGQLSCFVHCRSQDLLLGTPYNIASYALLTHMVAQVCSLEVADLIWSGGDCHIYLNHMPAVTEQLTRQPRELPILNMVSRDSIIDFSMDDFCVEEYNPYSAIKAPMAV